MTPWLVALMTFLVVLAIWRYFAGSSGSASGASADESPARGRGVVKGGAAAAEAAPPRGRSPSLTGLPSLAVEDDDELDLTRVTMGESPGDGDDEAREPSVVSIVYDDEAAIDMPTGNEAFILVSAVGQTDTGLARARNEDSFAILESPPLFVVADGMGGHRGGDVASRTAVDALVDMFQNGSFLEAKYPQLPRRSSELLQAVQAANYAVYEAAQESAELREMGTTMVCARFSPNKQRLYVAHVGDSRCYRFREGQLDQVTSDHTAAEMGVPGALGETLTRVLGIKSRVSVDLIFGKPRQDDRYLLCSDGLTKMASTEQIQEILGQTDSAKDAVDALVDAAIEGGGHDNVTVIVIDVTPP